MDLEKIYEELNKHPTRIGLKLPILIPELLKKLNLDKSDWQELGTVKFLFEVKKRYSETKEIVRQNLSSKNKKIFERIKQIIMADPNKDINSLSFITILRFVPKFNNGVNRIRKTFGIEPKKLLIEVCNQFPSVDKRLVHSIVNNDNFIEDIENQFSKNFHNKKKKRFWEKKLIKVWEKQDEVKKIIQEWEFNKFKSAFSEINSFLVFDLKLPKGFFEYLKKYILYGTISGRLDWLKKYSTIPEIQLILEPEQINEYTIFEPYLSVRIYGNTDVSKITSQIAKFQHFLPTYKSKVLSKPHIFKTTLWQAIYYYLRKVEGLSVKEANEIYQIKFKIVDGKQDFKILQRFEKLLGL